jgi:hypothetical protein
MLVRIMDRCHNLMKWIISYNPIEFWDGLLIRNIYSSSYTSARTSLIFKLTITETMNVVKNAFVKVAVKISLSVVTDN